jgi:hypothetical protein
MFVVAAPVMAAAAGEAGDPAPREPDTLVALPAGRTAQQETAPHAAGNEGKPVGTPFAWDAEIAARNTPFPTVRGDAASAVPV